MPSPTPATRQFLPTVLAVVSILSAAPAPLAAQEAYDVVLMGGRVMDPETGLDAIRNVGIRGQTIVAISEEPLEGTTVVDVSGLVVAPGFVDLHAHGQTVRANEFQAMDGVTTALELEGGVPNMRSFLEDRRGKSVLNFGASVSHGGVRITAMPQYAEQLAEVLGMLDAAGARDFTQEENARVMELIGPAYYEPVQKEHYGELRQALEDGMAAGGMGIGMAHQYYPGANHDEIYRVFEFAGEGGVPIYTHVRSMGIAAIQEVLANAVATGAPLHIVHINSMSLWDIETNLDLIRGARRAGVDVTTEAYPYTAASTSLESAIFDEGWQDRLQIGYGDLQWQETGERLTEETFNEYRAEGGVVIIHMMKPEWISKAISDPDVMVASDGMPYDPGAHPRSAGTFSRFLGRYVRDEGAMSLMDGLGKITYMPAQRLAAVSAQMARKGRVQVGSDADVTVFDPARIMDTADFQGGLSYSEGIEFVLVNGQFVVRDGALVEGARPGQAIVGRRVVF
ncbi:MAG: amidohydrolase family protein [Planctomycetota bacterium]|jgi:dihydroorotase